MCRIAIVIWWAVCLAGCCCSSAPTPPMDPDKALKFNLAVDEKIAAFEEKREPREVVIEFDGKTWYLLSEIEYRDPQEPLTPLIGSSYTLREPGEIFLLDLHYDPEHPMAAKDRPAEFEVERQLRMVKLGENRWIPHGRQEATRFDGSVETEYFVDGAEMEVPDE